MSVGDRVGENFTKYDLMKTSRDESLMGVS